MVTGECPSCACSEIITDYVHGEELCKKCGLVLKEMLFNFGPEWRDFDSDQKISKARTGGPVKFSKQSLGLTSEIDRRDCDIKGGAIPTRRKAQLYRLRIWQRRSRMGTSVDRNLSIALPELDRICCLLNVTDNLKEEAAMIYRKAVNHGLVRGRSVESVVAAVIYIVCRNHQTPKTLMELSVVSDVKGKDIVKSYKKLCHGLKIKLAVSTPMDYVSQFASALGLSGETEARAVEILEKAVELGVGCGRSPTGVAAAAIYIAGKLTGDRQLQSEMQEKLPGVTRVTISSRAEELVEALGIEFSER